MLHHSQADFPSATPAWKPGGLVLRKAAQIQLLGDSDARKSRRDASFVLLFTPDK